MAAKVKVKLNERGWRIYKENNGFWQGNIDEKGYSTFSYDYFEKLFFPMPHKEFSHEVKYINPYRCEGKPNMEMVVLELSNVTDEQIQNGLGKLLADFCDNHEGAGITASVLTKNASKKVFSIIREEK